MDNKYMYNFRDDTYFTANKIPWIKEEPTSIDEEYFDNNDFGGMRKSLSMSDLKQEPSYCKPIGTKQGSSKTKFVSLAESVYHYQRDTPGRFHSTRPQIFKPQCNTERPGLTKPQSPTLRCRSRLRPSHIMSQKEKEEMLIEEMKNFKIKAQPVPKSVIVGSQNLPEVPKKPNTIPEPFKLTEKQKKTVQTPEFVKKFKARPAPKDLLEKPQVPLRQPIAQHKQDFSHKEKKCEQKDKTVKELKNNHKTCKTQKTGPMPPKPFSFEKRDEEIRRRKEEKIRLLMEEERRMASQFKAQPLPNGVKKQMISAISKSSASNASSEKENYVKFEARPPVILYKEPFKPLLASTQCVKPVPFELTMEKRVAERQKFDKFLKEKEEQNEILRQQKIKEQMEAEEKAQAELRAKLVHHAKPIPSNAPFIPEKSSKLLTVPETPNLVRRLRKQ
ncbi:targeting protein for Xklp2-like [Battus philenor]|uniref:targeting protein for Xklp2-like n=1 Tax=Battus philenor TaxID=42288 RepID=UPI0035CFD322